MKKIIHVNQHAIRRNAKNSENEPVITIKTYRSNTYAHEVLIDGPCRIVYSADKPLACGARVWIETHAGVHPIAIQERPARPPRGAAKRCTLRHNAT